MSVELTKEQVNFESLIGEGAGQTMIGGELVLAERGREILDVLNLDGKATVKAVTCLEDKVSIEGEMSFELLYAYGGGEGAIDRLSVTSGFSHTMQIPGARPGMLCRTSLRMDHIGFEQTGGRKVKANVILSLTGRVFERSAVQAVVDIKAQEIQVLRGGASLDEFVTETSTQTVVKCRYETGEAFGDVGMLLRRDVDIVRTAARMSSGRLLVNAAANVRLLFKDELGEPHMAEHRVPFSCELQVPGLHEAMKHDLEFQIEEIYDELRDDDEGRRRIIDTELIVQLSDRVYQRRELEQVMDAYAPGRRYEMEKIMVRPLSYYGESAGTERISERLELGDEPEQVLGCIMKPVVTDTKLLEDRIAVEGVVNCCVLYQKKIKEKLEEEEDGQQALEATARQEELTFRSLVELAGARIDMLAEAGAAVTNVACQRQPDGSVLVSADVEIKAKAFSRLPSELSTGAAEGELPESMTSMPSLVVYMVQAGDSLWKIAKRYNTVIEDIVELNELEDPDSLRPGRRLLIPRKSFLKQQLESLS